jgi:hypothetical protein
MPPGESSFKTGSLEDGRIRSLLSRAVEVASVRAGELGGPKAWGLA